MNRKLLRQAQSALVIQDVLLHSSEVKAGERFSPFRQLPDAALSTQYKFGTTGKFRYSIDNEKEKHTLLEYRYETGLRMFEAGSSKSDNKEDNAETSLPLVEIETKFSAVYLLVDENISEEALDEFAKHNVGLNAWPYWREYAAATLSRMRLPPVVIPFYQVPDEAEES
ncbi:MAG TPA: hypothetical protein ENJ84_09235 [Gammaproteobacteria bacterium]|nr:hypothetical protein [Gammaproteobacteria bacterium]